jgi:hypothetical protein
MLLGVGALFFKKRNVTKQKEDERGKTCLELPVCEFYELL